MLWFLIGLFLGGFIGLVAASLCAVSSRADREGGFDD